MQNNAKIVATWSSAVETTVGQKSKSEKVDPQTWGFAGMARTSKSSSKSTGPVQYVGVDNFGAKLPCSFVRAVFSMSANNASKNESGTVAFLAIVSVVGAFCAT